MRTPATTLNKIVVLLASLAIVGLMAGCNIQPAGTSTDEHAVENRQYMALLNTKTGELKDVLTQFQTAVAAGDAVGMKAAASDASKIVESISRTCTLRYLTARLIRQRSTARLKRFRLPTTRRSKSLRRPTTFLPSSPTNRRRRG